MRRFLYHYDRKFLSRQNGFIGIIFHCFFGFIIALAFGVPTFFFIFALALYLFMGIVCLIFKDRKYGQKLEQQETQAAEDNWNNYLNDVCNGLNNGKFEIRDAENLASDAESRGRPKDAIRLYQSILDSSKVLSGEKQQAQSNLSRLEGQPA